MYATFEEFIDHQQSPGEESPLSHPGSQDAPPPPPAPSGGIGTNSKVSLTRDAAAFFACEKPSTMSALKPTVSLPTSSSRLRPRSPPTVVSDDLALASPRRSRRRRPRRLRRSVDNPLLDTISAIGGDSDEESPSLHYHYHNYNLQSHSPASCPRLHTETDLIGYAGCNSVDSGYKSACPTPDLSDLIYPEYRLEKRGSLASLASSGSSGGSNAGSKPRIPMGTRVMSRGGGVPRSPGGGGFVTPTRRVGSDGNYYEIDHLAALCQAFLTSPTETDNRNINGSRFSPRISPANLSMNHGTSPKDGQLILRDPSPGSPERRPRSASTGSRCSPSIRTSRKTMQSNSPLLASTGSLPRATSPGRRPSLSPCGRDDQRPPPAWSRHSSPGMSTSGIRGRRPPSPIVGVDQERNNELAILEKEIDVLLYGGRSSGNSQYYDVDSGREFSCPYGNSNNTQDAHACRPALASVRRLREELLETLTSSSVNEKTPVSVPGAVPSIAASVTSTESFSDSCISTSESPSSSLSCSSSSSPVSSDGSFKFCSSEVAKCVLAMLDDLPRPVAECPPDNLKATELLSLGVLRELKSISRKKRYRTTPYLREALTDQSDFDDDERNEDDTRSSSCSDYHLYEEIMYESSNKPPTHIPHPPSPPPLPKRPPQIFKSSIGSKSVDKGNDKYFTISTCNKCPCEYYPQRNKLLSRFSSKLKIEPFRCGLNNEGSKNSILSKNLPENHFSPPVPPIRTTSQMNTMNCVSMHLTPHSLNISSTQYINLPNTNKDESFTETALVQESVPSKISRIKPVPPVKKANKCLEQTSQKDEINTISTTTNSTKANICLPKESANYSHSSKPKQRNNLYSIFKDRQHRRFLSASLELEYNAQPDTVSNKEIKNEPNSVQVSAKSNNSISLSNPETKTIADNNEMSDPSQTTNSSRTDDLTECKPQPGTKDLNNYPSTSDVLQTQSKAYEKASLLMCRPNRVNTCSKTCSSDLNLNTQTEDDYGFHGFPHVV